MFGLAFRTGNCTAQVHERSTQVSLCPFSKLKKLLFAAVYSKKGGIVENVSSIGRQSKTRT